MFKKKKDKVRHKRDLWKLIRIFLVLGIIISATTLALELAIPLKLDDNTSSSIAVNITSTSEIPNIQTPESANIQEIARVMRSGFFKSETPHLGKPMADKTIETIKSQLKLQCIMDLNGEPVAYVKIKGEGLEQCRVGDSVDDLFTVLSIDKKSIEISIIGHRQTLKL